MTVTLSDFPVSFGTSGARGLVTELTDAYCWTFTRAFLNILEPRPHKLLIGHDLRPSSPAIAAACAAAARSAGVDVSYGGALPTPALALAAMERNLPAITVTGSHIPADRNGLKAYRPEGEITKADEQRMTRTEVESAPDLRPEPPGYADPEMLRRYVARYTGAFPQDALAGLRIGVYEHSSVARDLLHEVLRALGAETTALGRSDTFLPVDTEAIRPEDHERAAGFAKLHRVDAIVSTDGDADRPLLSDENGRWLRGDILGIVSARAIGAATVVTPISSNTALEKSGFFRKVIRTRIGSPYVIEGMRDQREPPVVGYEANGGFLLGSAVEIGGRRLAALPTRDAVLPILLALSAARSAGLRVSGLVGSLPRRFTHSDRLQGIPAGRSAELLDRIAADPCVFAGGLAGCRDVIAVDRTDGLRLSLADGDILHLRPSGNAPELRCYTESGDSQKAARLCGDALAFAKEHLAEA